MALGNRMFVSIMAIFLVFAVCFMVFQQWREKDFKIESLNARLQEYNARMNESLVADSIGGLSAIERYVTKHAQPHLRVTVIAADGKVVYDNRQDFHTMGNHLGRKEIAEALRLGQGSDIDRMSSTANREYFYSATYFPHEWRIIRTALPYDHDLGESLKADQHFLWFALAIIAVLIVVLLRYTRRMNDSISREQAEKENAMRRELTQNIAHELKTPVSSIQGYLETILENPSVSDEMRSQFLCRSYQQTQRLTALLQDISTLNRMDFAPEQHEFCQVDVTTIIRQIAEETALAFTKLQMTFHINIPSSITLQGNHSLLYSIFRNLTDNAIAYAGVGATVTLSATEYTDYWHFTFSDNGIGVASEHLPRLFERFYRIDKGRSRSLGGTGLGLAIVKNAVLLHGGYIEVHPNNGAGLCFEFTLKTR